MKIQIWLSNYVFIAKLTQNSEGRAVVLWFSMFRCRPDRGNTPRTTSWPRIAEFSSLQTATTPKHLDVLNIWHGLKNSHLGVNGNG